MTALKLNDAEVKKGHIVPVWNTDRPKFSNENRKYYVIHVECLTDEGESTEFPIMLTAKELEKATTRALNNQEDVPNKSFISDLLD